MLSLRGFLHRAEEMSRGLSEAKNKSYKFHWSYSDYEEMDIRKTSHFALALLAVVVLSSCANKDGAHTTAISHVPPPPRQVLKIVSRPTPRFPEVLLPDSTADTGKPFLIVNLAKGSSFRLGEDVPISFLVENAKLKGEGGEFRIRYIVDDDDMQWRDTTEGFWLTGWLPGKHTIRVELIGPNGWPYKNGNANIVTREISVEP